MDPHKYPSYDYYDEDKAPQEMKKPLVNYDNSINAPLHTHLQSNPHINPP